MKKPILIGAALLLATTAIGAAIAAGSLELSGHRESRHAGYRTDDGEGGRFQIAREMRERDHGRGHGHARQARSDDDDDDDDDDDEGGGRAAVPQNGPADPNAPVPDNGLFQGKARPKVEVQ